MLKEIHEQPEALRQSLLGRVGRDDRIRGGARSAAARLRDVTRIELVACGTAFYAALVGAAALQDWTGLPARRRSAPSSATARRRSTPDARHRGHAVRRDGRHDRPDALAREQGCPIIAVTNTVGSAITREADAVLFLQAGPEVAVAASKTFVTQVTTLIVLAAAIAKARGTLGAEQELELGAALRALPDGRSGPWSCAGARELARRYVNSRGFMFVGRGYGVSRRAGGRAQAEGGQLRPCRGLRGGRAEARARSRCSTRTTRWWPWRRARAIYEKLISNVMEGRARDARVIAVATEGDEQIERFADDVCWVPDTHEALAPCSRSSRSSSSPTTSAVARGTDVDQPRNLAKSVTVE